MDFRDIMSIEQLNNRVKTLKECVSAKHANLITVGKVQQNFLYFNACNFLTCNLFLRIFAFEL